MKPNSKQNRGLGSRANRVFEQARTQFGRAVIDVLSTSLEALGERLGGEKLETFQDPDRIEDQPRHRLRRMLQNDRGLGARQHESGRFQRLSEEEPLQHALPEEPETTAPAEAAEPIVEANAIAAEPAAAEPEARVVETEAAQPAATASAAVESAPDPIERTDPEPVAVAEPAAIAAAAARAPEASAADEPPICDEPIRTRSMARLLASQGHHQRALSIYDVLLAANASDAALAAEAAALRNLAEQQPSPQ